MSNPLQKLLAQRPYLLADGATGTNLFDAGLAGDAPELWNVDHPDRIETLHRDMVDAGADIILTNSFGGSAIASSCTRRMTGSHEINREAARIAAAWPIAQRPPDHRRRLHRPHRASCSNRWARSPSGARRRTSPSRPQALADGGVDVLWIETMSSASEVPPRSPARRDRPAGRHHLTFDTNGRTMMGVTPAECASSAHDLDPQPLAYGANCGIGPSELVAALVNLGAAARPGDIIVAKGNCGVPYFDEGKIRYDGTPELMADYARLARDAGARIIGGCCGTTPEHLMAMRDALAEHVPGGKPTLVEIAERLGKLTAGTAAGGLSAEAAGGGRRSRRRRDADAAF